MLRKDTLFDLFFVFACFLPRASCEDASCDPVCSEIRFHVTNGEDGKELEDVRGRLAEMTVKNTVECFRHCAFNWRCTSFNICEKTCQLNGKNRFTLKDGLRSSNAGCVYYDFPRVPESCKRTASCSVASPCCSTDPPLCLNGGTCDVGVSDASPRFSCVCATGFYGNGCEIDHPKTCLDYWPQDAEKPVSGEYTILDEFDNAYNVSCDFDSEDNFAWTLIESFAMENEFHIKAYPFTLNRPLNEHNFNWQLFRLPKHVMVGMAARSEFWRGTCSFPIYGTVHPDPRDYVRVRMSEMNITSYVATVTDDQRSCILVDYFNIKGTSCVNCTTAIFQVPGENLHVNAGFGHRECHCTFDPPNEISCTRYFGTYIVCHDSAFRCSETASSTTQFWFGAKKT